MQLRIDGGSVVRVSFDEALTILTSTNYELRVETKASIVVADQPARAFDPGNPGEASFDLVSLFRKEVGKIEVSDAGGLTVHFGGNNDLIVPADPDYEAWQIVGPRQERMVCMPDGELAVWGELGVQT